MHPYVFVPLSAALIGTAITAANVARAPTHRATPASAALLGVTAIWGLVDFMTVTSNDAASAVAWIRCIPLLALMLGPLCALLLAALKPDLALPLRRIAWVGGIASLPLAAVVLSTDLVIARVLPSMMAVWRVEPGPLFPWLLVQSLALPLLTLALVVRSAGWRLDSSLDNSDRLLALVLGVPLVLTFVTEAVLPMLGVDFPRVGALCLAVLGGAAWLYYFSGFDGAVSEAGMARRILERLPTGVALIETDGRLRAVNEPLARWLGLSRRALIGRSLSSFMLMPLPEMLALENENERETELLPDGREPIPVAIGVAEIHDRQGGAVGYVVSCRDLREKAALESHLDTARQMATVGEMAAGIAHEVNNPVAYIQANMNLMRRHYNDLSAMLFADGVEASCPPEFVDSGAERVEEALGGLVRISSIVREVRAFAHAGQGERQLADVNELLESAIQLAALHRGSIDLVDRDLGDLPRIEIGGQELKQAFFGVAQWAFASAEPGVRVAVSTALAGDSVEIAFEVRVGYVAHSSELASRSPSGGIQLVIAREILEEEEGDLHVETGEDGVCRLLVSVPLEPASPDEDDPPTGVEILRTPDGDAADGTDVPSGGAP